MAKIKVKNREEQKAKVRVGQFYKMKDQEYRIFLVADLYKEQYALIELSDGVAWGELVDDIDDIFDGGDFILMNNVTLEIDV